MTASAARAQVSVRVGVVVADSSLFSRPTGGLTVAPRYDWRQAGAEGFVEIAGSAFRGGSILQLTVRDAHTRGMFASEGTLEAGFVSTGASTGRLQQAFGAGHRIGDVLISAGLAAGVLRDTAGTFRPQGSGRLGLSYAFADLKAQRFDAGPRFRYTDFTAQVSGSGAAGVVLGAFGVRVFDGSRRSFVYRADVARRLTRLLQAELSLGRAPRSPEGFSQGGYILVGMRVIAAPAITRPVIERGASGTRVVLAVSGSEVSISGDWNDWSATPMTREADGRWSVVLPIGAGAHKFTLTVDGKTIVPRGVPKLPDGFGGEVGLLVIG